MCTQRCVCARRARMIRALFPFLCLWHVVYVQARQSRQRAEQTPRERAAALAELGEIAQLYRIDHALLLLDMPAQRVSLAKGILKAKSNGTAEVSLTLALPVEGTASRSAAVVECLASLCAVAVTLSANDSSNGSVTSVTFSLEGTAGPQQSSFTNISMRAAELLLEDVIAHPQPPRPLLDGAEATEQTSSAAIPAPLTARLSSPTPISSSTTSSRSKSGSSSSSSSSSSSIPPLDERSIVLAEFKKPSGAALTTRAHRLWQLYTTNFRSKREVIIRLYNITTAVGQREVLLAEHCLSVLTTGRELRAALGGALWGTVCTHLADHADVYQRGRAGLTPLRLLEEDGDRTLVELGLFPRSNLYVK